MGFFFLKMICPGKSISDEKYENSKMLYTELKMRDMGYLNDLYNAQEVFLFCEIFEYWFQIMYKKNMYNPRKFNSASKISGCIQKEQSKLYYKILVLLTKNKIIEIFEKTVTRGFSCVNTHLSFDTELLMPNYSTSDFDKMSIDESYKAFRRDDLKAVYSIKINEERRKTKKKRKKNIKNIKIR